MSSLLIRIFRIFSAYEWKHFHNRGHKTLPALIPSTFGVPKTAAKEKAPEKIRGLMLVVKCDYFTMTIFRVWLKEGVLSL